VLSGEKKRRKGGKTKAFGLLRKMFISTSAFSYIRSAADDAAPVRSEIAVEQARMIRITSSIK
jgi:hypothetical protein